MAALFDRIAAVLTKQQSQITELKHQLAEALADDAADAAAIAAAEEAAAAAEAKLPELQALLNADADEDQKISDLLDTFEGHADHESGE